MRRRHWLTSTLLSAAIAAVPAVRALAQSADAPADVSQAEFDQLTRTLGAGDGLPSRERDEAAKRLLQRPSERATAALLDALSSGRWEAQAAVARAIADSGPQPPAAFLDPLMRCLQRDIMPDLAGAASRALANFRGEPAARARIRDFILSANVNENARAQAVRGLGAFNDRDTAEFLVERVLKGDVGPRLSDAAADALVEMTGKVELGRDVGQWDRWWQGERNLDPQAFLQNRRDEREGAAQKNAERLRQLAPAIRRLVVDAYRGIDPAERQAYIVGNVDDPLPELRVAYVGLVNMEQSRGTVIGAPVLEKLRGLIGDSSPEVRQAVAGALYAVNDPLAARPLLAQLQRERIPSVKAAMITALAPTKDVDAVPELIRQLDDPAFQVAEAAARALAELGTEITKNQALARRVSTALSAAMGRTARARGAGRLREFLADAMVPLHDPALVAPVLFPLLEERDGNTPNVRRSAVKALASMNVPNLSADIAIRLADRLRNDSDKGVRLEAANALGIVGSPAQRDTLLGAADQDTDVGVRDAAWKSLSSLFDQFGATELNNLASDRRVATPDKQLTIFLALNKKLVAAGPLQAGDTAVNQQDIGALYLEKLDKPAEAIPYLMAALNHWDTQGAAVPGVRYNTETVQRYAMKAQLRAKKYKDAMAFGTQRITRDPSNIESIGREILDEANRLDRANQIASALELLTEAKALGDTKGIGQQILRKEQDLRLRNPGMLEHPWWNPVLA